MIRRSDYESITVAVVDEHLAALNIDSSSERKYSLRATISLARRLRDSGRSDEGRAILGEIYNWFTEGFDIADMRDAKTLLDELSR